VALFSVDDVVVMEKCFISLNESEVQEATAVNTMSEVSVVAPVPVTLKFTHNPTSSKVVGNIVGSGDGNGMGSCVGLCVGSGVG